MGEPAFIPKKLTEHGLREAHPRPLVSRGKGTGTYSCFRTSPSDAWNYAEVEYANAGSSVAALVLDCDTPLEMTRGLPDLPPPNWIVWRPANDHSHICWTLAEPVHRYPAARIGPLRYFASIAEYFTAAVGADPSYAGVLAHNPLSVHASPYRTVWGGAEPYTLDQLASVIPFAWNPPTVRQTGVGRNVDLFEAGMRWAGNRANANLPVLPALLNVNQDFAHPLPVSEVQATARSIDKYRTRWAARGWHNPRWLARQAARGRKGGRPRMYELGREPWARAGVSRQTWERRQRAQKRDAKANTDRPDSNQH